MAIPHIMPLGFIHRRTESGGIIMLADPEDSRNIKMETPITLWQYSPGRLAAAKVRGTVSRVGYVTATFKIVESRIDPRWPVDQEIIRPGVPVYLAQPGSFEPDLSRMTTPEQAEELQRLARRHRQITRGSPPNPGPAEGGKPSAKAPSNNHNGAST